MSGEFDVTRRFDRGLTILVMISLVAVLIMVATIMWMASQQSRWQAERIAVDKIENHVDMDVVRIFMHLPNEYTFVTEENGEYKLHHFRDCDKITWLRDAKPNEPMHIEGWYGSGSEITVHLHNVEEINGAGWKRRKGKHWEQGETIEVE